MNTINDFQQELNRLHDFITDKNEKIKKSIITDHVADEICKGIDYKLSDSLKSLFGDKNDTRQKGVLEFFDYENFKYGLTLNYWSFRQDRQTFADGYYREVPFFKGRRWSDIDGTNTGYDNFYFYFDVLKECLNVDNAPVSFLAKRFYPKYQHITVITKNVDEILSLKLTSTASANESILYFPEFSDSEHDAPHLVAFVKAIKDFKNKRDHLSFNRKNENIETTKQEIANMITSAINEFSLKNNKSKYKKVVKKILKDMKSLTDKPCDEIDLFKMLLLYQYYDVPYILHFFLPGIEECKFRLKTGGEEFR